MKYQVLFTLKNDKNKLECYNRLKSQIKILQGSNSLRTEMLQLLLSTHQLIFYISTKFQENNFNNFNIINQAQIPYENIQRGITALKMKTELQFLFSAYCLTCLHIYSKYHENILNVFKVMEQTQILQKFTKDPNSH